MTACNCEYIKQAGASSTIDLDHIVIRKDLLKKYGEAVAYVFGAALALSNWHHAKQNKCCRLAHFSYVDMARIVRYTYRPVRLAMRILVREDELTPYAGSRGHEMSYEVNHAWREKDSTKAHIVVNPMLLDIIPQKRARHHTLIVETQRIKNRKGSSSNAKVLLAANTNNIIADAKVLLAAKFETKYSI